MRDYTEVTEIIIHCSDTPKNMDIGATEIRQWHVNDNGWSDIGYNAIVRRSGLIEAGRDLDDDGDFLEEVGAHARGHNANSIGICLIGGRSSGVKSAEFNFSHKQMCALHDFLVGLLKRCPNAVVIGHRDIDPGKACPSFDASTWFYGEC